MSIFEKWNLESTILDAIKSRGWTSPTEIQADGSSVDVSTAASLGWAAGATSRQISGANRGEEG